MSLLMHHHRGQWLGVSNALQSVCDTVRMRDLVRSVSCCMEASHHLGRFHDALLDLCKLLCIKILLNFIGNYVLHAGRFAGIYSLIGGTLRKFQMIGIGGKRGIQTNLIDSSWHSFNQDMHCFSQANQSTSLQTLVLHSAKNIELCANSGNCSAIGFMMLFIVCCCKSSIPFLCTELVVY